MRILITGGCGYKGTVLVVKLLKENYYLRVLDTQWFGNFLPSHKNLDVIKGDVRELKNDYFKNIDIIIHLASVANDPCSDLNPKLTWEISCLATMQLCQKAKENNINRIIYASSGSVYGINDKPEITEDTELNPISEYNKTKMCAERILLSYKKDMNIQIIRPATVCGYSPRMRYDVAVNLITMQALETKKIIVLGGNQIRPNIHIDDITNLYLFLLKTPSAIGIFNAGFENISILEIANRVKKKIPDTNIEIKESKDPRSYKVNSDKLIKLGFKPKKNVEIAINELIDLFKEGKIKNEDRFNNLIWMKKNNYY